MRIAAACRTAPTTGNSLRLYGLEDAFTMLPDLLEPSDVVGHVTAEGDDLTGLCGGTPVVAGSLKWWPRAYGTRREWSPQNGQAIGHCRHLDINQVVSAEPGGDVRLFIGSGFGKGAKLNIESSATSPAISNGKYGSSSSDGDHEDSVGYCNSLRRTEPAPDESEVTIVSLWSAARI